MGPFLGHLATAVSHGDTVWRAGVSLALVASFLPLPIGPHVFPVDWFSRRF